MKERRKESHNREYLRHRETGKTLLRIHVGRYSQHSHKKQKLTGGPYIASGRKKTRHKSDVRRHERGATLLRLEMENSRNLNLTPKTYLDDHPGSFHVHKFRCHRSERDCHLKDQKS